LISLNCLPPALRLASGADDPLATAWSRRQLLHSPDPAWTKHLCKLPVSEFFTALPFHVW